MASLDALLKSEITRLSKKATREQFQSLQASVSQQRKQLSELKQLVASLRKDVAQLQRNTLRQEAASQPAGGVAPKVRFQARGLRSLRQRLGLSAEGLGKLVGVSSQTVYNWETQKSAPGPDQMATLAKIRSLGKREAAAQLEKLMSK